MRIANPVMQKRQQEIRERYANDPSKLQEETSKLFKEFGNPLAGCFPLLLQMPLLCPVCHPARVAFCGHQLHRQLQVLPSSRLLKSSPRVFDQAHKRLCRRWCALPGRSRSTSGYPAGRRRSHDGSLPRHERRIV